MDRRIAVFGVAFAGACASKLEFPDPIPVDATFPSAPAAGAELERYQQAAAWSLDHAGLALVVLRGGQVVFEDYDPGYDPETPIHLFSGTKSFSCPLVLQLEADGLLALDEPVTASIPHLAAGDGVLVRHLLDFSSGIEGDFWTLSVDGMRKNQRVEDKVAFAAALPASSPAGERFAYGSQHQWVLSGVIEQKTGTSAFEAMQARLLGPLGLRTSGWHHDPAGHSALPYGAWTTAREWAKFGVMLLDDGEWQGTRVLPAGAAARCFAPSAANPAYGLTFWRNDTLAESADLGGIRTLVADGPIFGVHAPSDLVAAAGAQDQRLYLIPSLDLVIVRLGEGHRRFRDEELLTLLLGPPE
jgi:CubicO group peptidase (beta-lactamase class C family)